MLQQVLAEAAENSKARKIGALLYHLGVSECRLDPISERYNLRPEAIRCGWTRARRETERQLNLQVLQ